MEKTIEGTITINRKNKKQNFKNIAPFKLSISKIDNTFVHNAEDVDIIMPMFDLWEYSDNYSMTLDSLWRCYREEVNYSANEIIANRRFKQQQDNNW